MAAVYYITGIRENDVMLHNMCKNLIFLGKNIIRKTYQEKAANSSAHHHTKIDRSFYGKLMGLSIREENPPSKTKENKTPLLSPLIFEA